MASANTDVGTQVPIAQPSSPGGGDAAPADGKYLPESAVARDRQRLAHLYAIATDRSNGTSAQAAWASYESARVAFQANYGVDLGTPPSAVAATTSGSSRALATSTLATYKTLNVTWSQQAKSYYCGPATAYMILKYRGFTKSALNGASLSQSALAGANYLKTDAQGYTTTWTYYDSGFTVNDMSRGLNQWAYGAVQNGFYPDKILTEDDLKEAYRYSIDNSRPFAVSTYEKPNGPRYNNHPSSRTGEIGHWVAIYGYEASGGTAKIADPAAGITGYTNSAQKFYMSTSSLYSYAVSRYAVW